MSSKAAASDHWCLDVDLVDAPQQPQSLVRGKFFQLPQRALWLAGDIRLDNAQELARLCGMPADAAPAEVVLQLYARRRQAFASCLLGDFSFALYDAGQRVLWLVRDHMGIRPLYYQFSAGRCIASDSLDAMLTVSQGAPELNASVVAEWCQHGHVFNQTETFYQGIHKVPRASLCRVSREGVRVESYWSLDAIAPLHYDCEQDYVEHLHALLRQAVYSRLPAAGRAAAHSSGGLDSTPIAILAGRAARELGQSFQSYNWCKPTAGHEGDCHEWTDARLVAEQEAFTHVETGTTAADLKRIMLCHDVSRDGTTMFEYESAVLAHARQVAVGTIFSGFGGDEILTIRSAEWHEPALRQGQWFQVWRQLACEADPDQRWLALRIAARFSRSLARSMGIWPQAVLPVVKHQAHLLSHYRPLMRPETVWCHATVERGYGQLRTLRQQQHHMIELGYHQERIESWAILGERSGVRYAYPYLDKRLVEFALALPSQWYFRRGQNRYLYRKALGDALPPYLGRKGKLPERERVKQLMQARIQALADVQVHDMIASSDSSYVDTRALLEQCRKIHALDITDLNACIAPIRAITTAVLALNLNRWH